MAQVKSVAHARTANVCGRCGKTINVGDPYRTWSFFRAGRFARCMDDGCTPKPWETEPNEKLRLALEIEGEVSRAGEADEQEDAAESLRIASSLAVDLSDLFDDAIGNWSGTGLENTERAAIYADMSGAVNDWSYTAGELAEQVADWPEGNEEVEDWRDLIAELEPFPTIEV